MTHSSAGVLKDPLLVNWKDTGKTIPVDRKTVGIPPRTTTQVRTGTGPSVSPISIGNPEIEDPRRSIIPQEVRNTEPLDAYINRFPAKHRDLTTGWSKLNGSKSFTNESADVYAHSRMNFRSDTVLSESPNLMTFGLLDVNTADELRSVFVPTNRVRSLTDGFNWIPPGHDISEATADIVSETKSKKHYNFKDEFETRGDKIVDQDFGCQNDPMIRPSLESTPIGTNTTNGTTSPIDSIPSKTKTPEPMPLTRPAGFPEQNGKAHVPGKLDSDP